MILLLDSHAFLWWAENPLLVAEPASSAIADPRNDVRVSLASIWELAIKEGLGKLVLPPDMPTVLERAGIDLFAIALNHVMAAGRLPRHHGDPFDRMLVAQARIEGMTVVTRDPIFATYGVATMSA